MGLLHNTVLLYPWAGSERARREQGGTFLERQLPLLKELQAGGSGWPNRRQALYQQGQAEGLWTGAQLTCPPHPRARPAARPQSGGHGGSNKGKKANNSVSGTPPPALHRGHYVLGPPHHDWPANVHSPLPPMSTLRRVKQQGQNRYLWGETGLRPAVLCHEEGTQGRGESRAGILGATLPLARSVLTFYLGWSLTFVVDLNPKTLGPTFFSTSLKSKWVIEIGPTVLNFLWGAKPRAHLLRKFLKDTEGTLFLAKRISLGIWNCSQSFILSSLGLPSPHVVTICPRYTHCMLSLCLPSGPTRLFLSSPSSSLVRVHPGLWNKTTLELVDAISITQLSVYGWK